MWIGDSTTLDRLTTIFQNDTSKYVQDYAKFGIEVCTNEIAIKSIIDKIIKEDDLVSLSAYITRIEHIMTPTTDYYINNYFECHNALDTFSPKKQMLLYLFGYHSNQLINKSDFRVFGIELQKRYLGFSDVSEFYKYKFGEI
jgi:hypothetical protein